MVPLDICVQGIHKKEKSTDISLHAQVLKNYGLLTQFLFATLVIIYICSRHRGTWRRPQRRPFRPRPHGDAVPGGAGPQARGVPRRPRPAPGGGGPGLSRRVRRQGRVSGRGGEVSVQGGVRRGRLLGDRGEQSRFVSIFTALVYFSPYDILFQSSMPFLAFPRLPPEFSYAILALPMERTPEISVFGNSSSRANAFPNRAENAG